MALNSPTSPPEHQAQRNQHESYLSHFFHRVIPATDLLQTGRLIFPGRE